MWWASQGGVSRSIGYFPCLKTTHPGFDSWPEASPQCHLRGGRSYCYTVQFCTLGCKESEKIISCNGVCLAFGLLMYAYLTQKLGIICSVYHCSDQTVTGLVFMGKFTFAQCSPRSSALSGSRRSCACYNSILIQRLINFPALGQQIQSIFFLLTLCFFAVLHRWILGYSY